MSHWSIQFDLDEDGFATQVRYSVQINSKVIPTTQLWNIPILVECPFRFP
jgi:hypothetical protein